jgi:hypothetical protein
VRRAVIPLPEMAAAVGVRHQIGGRGRAAANQGTVQHL